MPQQSPLGDQSVLEASAEHGPGEDQREMLTLLEQHVARRRASGETLETLGISTGTWLALGKPEIAAGVRIVPLGPQTDLPE